MSLKDRVTEDMKEAMRARQADRLSTIRMLLAACKQKEVDERVVLDDAAVIAIVDRLIKQRKDSVAAFAQAGRTDLVDKETAEIRVLEAYLPQRLDAGQIEAEVARIVAATGATFLALSAWVLSTCMQPRAITAMSPENPAVEIYRHAVTIVPTGDSPAATAEPLSSSPSHVSWYRPARYDRRGDAAMTFSLPTAEVFVPWGALACRATGAFCGQ